MSETQLTLTEEQAAKFEKIRGLLRKAESTEFEEEANSFFAKAQELMIRYRIDEATLWASDPSRREEIIQLDIEIKDQAPGAGFKRELLAAIARLSSCRMYYMPGQNLSRVVGYPKDTLWVEMLYTSVTKQGSFKMILAQAKDGKGMHTKTFRNNYWRGYCEQLTYRLREAYNTAHQAVAYTGSQALVLTSRKDAVDQWVRDNLNLGRGRATYGGTYNDKAANHGRMAANTTDISGGASTNIGTRKQGQLNG